VVDGLASEDFFVEAAGSPEVFLLSGTGRLAEHVLAGAAKERDPEQHPEGRLWQAHARAVPPEEHGGDGRLVVKGVGVGREELQRDYAEGHVEDAEAEQQRPKARLPAPEGGHGEGERHRGREEEDGEDRGRLECRGRGRHDGH